MIVCVCHPHHHSFAVVVLPLVSWHNSYGLPFRRWFIVLPFSTTVLLSLFCWDLRASVCPRSETFRCRVLLHLSLIFSGARVLTFLALDSLFGSRYVEICMFQGLICLHCMEGFYVVQTGSTSWILTLVRIFYLCSLKIWFSPLWLILACLTKK